ncbi:MAG: hypothetical protein AB7V18_00590 [Pyrinomonadaceae bacterium]
MSEIDPTAFAEKAAAMFDDQLIAALSINRPHYSPSVIRIFEAEAERRGIAGDVQHVHFDVFLNSGGYAGRLVLLEEQLMFLSTGMAATSGTKGIAGELYSAQRNVAASESDFSALDNEGSWIYFLDQIVECTPASRFLSGRELQFVINEADGGTLNGVVNCGDLSGAETDELARQIITTRDELKKRIGG